MKDHEIQGDRKTERMKTESFKKNFLHLRPSMSFNLGSSLYSPLVPSRCHTGDFTMDVCITS